MLDCYLYSGGRDVEHIEDNGLRATILATMDGADYFDQRFTLVEGALRTILTDNCQVALLNDAVVDDVMMMPAGLSSDRKIQADYSQFRFTLREVRQLCPIPTL